VAAFAHGWSADGILGYAAWEPGYNAPPSDLARRIGPPGLTAGTANAEYIVPTVTNNLYKQGKIAIAAVGIAFAPATSESVTNGVLTFGGADATLYVGNLSYTPLTTVSPASKYWGVAQTVSYGNTTIMPLASGIVDTVRLSPSSPPFVLTNSAGHDAHLPPDGHIHRLRRRHRRDVRQHHRPLDDHGGAVRHAWAAHVRPRRRRHGRPFGERADLATCAQYGHWRECERDLCRGCGRESPFMYFKGIYG
jgi:hypothetical protein